MKKQEKILTAIATVLVVIMAVVVHFQGYAQEAQENTSTSSAVPWPMLYGQVGPFGVNTPTELTASTSAGFNLFMHGYILPKNPLLPLMAQTHAKYVDTRIWNLFYAAFSPQIKAKTPWVITPEAEQSFLASVSQYLSDTAQDNNVVAYYILDDNPGADIHELLEKVHTLVVEANRTSVFPRPTICAFGGTLDTRFSIDAPFNTYLSSFTKALVNFSPSACDTVALYPYGSSNHGPDPTLIDWSMANLLPKELDMLKAKGWDQASHPLIGIPQTFSYSLNGSSYYVLPTAQDVETQITAYCQGGAIALLPYSWNDSFTGTKSELYNTPDLVQGVQQGVANCRSRYWTALPAVVPETPSTPAPVITPPPPSPAPQQGYLSGGMTFPTSSTPLPAVSPSDVAPVPIEHAESFWTFIPLVKHAATPPTAASVVQPTISTKKKSYDIIKAVYVLNGVVVHATTTVPDGWNIDTTTMQDGSYTLDVTYTYADNTTDTTTSVFTVDNTPTIAQKIILFIQNLLK